MLRPPRCGRAPTVRSSTAASRTCCASCAAMSPPTSRYPSPRRAGRIAWALGRFEMGCERPHDTEALSDYLLALESLLDARDESGRANLTLRLAALCAEEGERRAVQRRAELAFALERWV